MYSDLNIFENPTSEKRTRCAICQTGLGAPLIELPRLPITDIYVKEKLPKMVGYADQSFHLCQECGHGQLSTMIDPGVLYGDYALRSTRTSGSRKSNDFFISFINRVVKDRQFKTILEVGCNDLYLLNKLDPKAERLIGIDPILKGKEDKLSNDKITVIGDLFENVDLGNLDDALVINSHFLEHVREPRSVVERVLDKSTDDTLFIFQFPLLDHLVSRCRFDQIFHHHLHYFSLRSFIYLLNELSCELVHTEVNFHYWGTLLVAFRKSSKRNMRPAMVDPLRVLKNYNIFRERMSGANEYLKSLEGERLIGYGAGMELPVVAYHLGNDFSSFDCIVDDDQNKEGLFYINLPVSIRSPAAIDSWENVNVIVTAIGFSRAILGKLIPLNPKRIIVPLDV